MPTRKEAAQQRNAVRQQARQELADLLGIPRRQVSFPHSNRELEETHNRIQVIRDRINQQIRELGERRAHEEFLNLGRIDSNISQDLDFERRDHVKIGGEIVDSNFITIVPSTNPHWYDYHNFLLESRGQITGIIDRERTRLNSSLKVRIGIYLTIKRAKNHQENLFTDDAEAFRDDNDDNNYEVRYNFPCKSRNMSVFPTTNLDDIYDVAIMRIDEKLDNLSGCGSGWTIVAVAGAFIEIIKYTPLTASGFLQDVMG